MSKRKIKLACSELTDVDVNHISFVRRPASRVTFGIMKADKSGGTTMIDLSNVFLRKNDKEDEGTSAPVTPVVTSIIVNGAVPTEVIDLLKTEGFNVDDPVEENGVTVFTQDDDFDGEEHVVKISDTIAMTVGVIKAEGKFAERCAERGFYPSISIATDLLQGELYRAVEKSDSPKAASEKVANIIGDYGAYMTGLISSLPGTVFKAEETIAKMDSTPVDAASGSDASGDDPKDDVKKAEGDEPKDPVDKSDDDDDEGNDDGGTQAIDIKSIITEVTKGVTDAIAPKLTELSERVDGVVTKVDEAVAKADAADKTVRNSVFGGVFGDDPDPEPEIVGKSESLPLLDTGFGMLGRTEKA